MTDRSDISELARLKIDQMRKRLLDATRRNSLVHLPIESKRNTSFIRFVDVMLEPLSAALTGGNQLMLKALPAEDSVPADEQTNEFKEAFKRYKASKNAKERIDAAVSHQAKKTLEQEMRREIRGARGMAPIPQSINKEPKLWAELHGISPSFDLSETQTRKPAKVSGDKSVQTLLFPESLIAHAKKLRDRHRSIERESGVSTLHFVFGVLEWCPPSEQKTYLSPLLLLEGGIEKSRGIGSPKFSVTGGEKIAENPTLKIKLNNEFSIDLPAYDGQSLEEYFIEIDKIKPPDWTWHVRREVMVGILSSASLAMYQDLDPEKRPIHEDQTVSNILSQVGSEISEFAPIADTDSTESTRKVPYLVMDADASQFSALLDVANGENIAIEGPPGTGKSQTIVNLIASAIADGKKVLFVAEKLTALEVVYSRLVSVGLGPFILPLIAGPRAKEQIYDGLQGRFELQSAPRTSERSLIEKRERLQKLQSELKEYLEILGEEYGNSGLTVFQIVSLSISKQSALAELPSALRRLPVKGDVSLTREQIREVILDAKRLEQEFVDNPIPKVWLEASTMIPDRDEAEAICEELRALIDKLSDVFLTYTKSAIGKHAGGGEVSIERLKTLPNTLKFVFEILDNYPKALAACDGEEGREAIRQLQAAIADMEGALSNLDRFLAHPRDPGQAEGLKNALHAYRKLGGFDVSSIVADLEKCESDKAQIDDWIVAVQHLPQDIRSDRSLSELHRFAVRASELDPDIRRVRFLVDSKQLASSLERLKNELEQHRAEANRLSQTFSNWGDIDPDEARRHAMVLDEAGPMSFLSRRLKRAKEFCEHDLGATAASNSELATALRDLAKHQYAKDNINSSTEFRNSLGSVFQGIETDARFLERALDSIADLERNFRDQALVDYAFQEDLETLVSLGKLPSPDCLTTDEFKSKRVKILDQLNALELEFDERNKHLKLFLTAPTDETQIRTAIREHQRLIDAQDRAENSVAKSLLGRDFLGAETDKHLVDALAKLSELRTSDPESFAAISGLNASQRRDLCRSFDNIGDELEEHEDRFERLKEALKWPEDYCLQTLSERRDEFSKAADNSGALSKRASQQRLQDGLTSLGFEEVLKLSAEGKILSLSECVEALIYKSLAMSARSRYGIKLTGRSGSDLDALRSRIAELDAQIIELAPGAVVSNLLERAQPPQGVSTGRKSELTDNALIVHELQKKRRIGVRELTRRARGALQELMPCWMMSPLTVAQYLDDKKFDLLVIDEASQMTPESAIGAISRADQVVVVGDTNQLPPTSFFRRTLDESDVDQDEVEDSESILALANVAYRPIRQLNWHYRSQHSALIQFSNHWIYKDRLSIFPAANEADELLGVRHCHTGGLYSGSTNRIEAEQLIARAIQIMSTERERSIGIATMNVKQKELIEQEFELASAKDPKVREYIDHWERKNSGIEEFFVRNLETIQGDERDIILISTVYGPEETGARVMQRFSINTATGHRRLNVLFTRAKRRIETFTSLNANDIVINPTSSRGVKMFKGWLEYTATGRVPSVENRGGDFESPFESHVAQVLEGKGLIVTPQVGVSGFRIDLGVEHPDWPHGFILGVECDGAAYHSSRSSRDRDRLRQDVLEKKGWRLHRIWSTDWFSDPETETDRLVAAIENALTAAKETYSSMTESDAAVGLFPNKESDEIDGTVRRK